MAPRSASLAVQFPANQLPATHVWLLAALTLLSFGMRLAQVDESLWVDELHTAWVVADGVNEVAPRALLGNQSPLYFYLVWITTQVAGLHEFALRAPSLAAGVALTPLTFLIVQRWTRSPTAALLAAFVATVDRDFLFYATEARVYALMQLAALLRLAVFVRLLAAPGPAWRAAYVGLAGLMFHFHYTTALLWLGEAAVIALQACSASREVRYGRRFLVDSALMAMLCLPAAPHVWEVYARRDNWAAFIVQPSLEPLFTTRLKLRALPIAAALAPGLAVWLLGAAGKRRKASEPATLDLNSAPPDPRALEQRRLRRLLLATLVWALTPLLVAAAFTAVDAARLLLYRYLISSATAVPVLAGVLCGLCPARAGRATAAAATVLALLAVTAPDYAAQFRRDGRLLGDRSEDWRSATAFINAHDDGLPAFIHAGLIEAEAYAASPDPRRRQFCLLPVLSLYRLTPPERKLLPLAAPRLASAQWDVVSAHGGAWVMLRTSPAGAARAVAAMQRDAARRGLAFRIDQRQSFGTITAARLTASAAQ